MTAADFAYLGGKIDPAELNSGSVAHLTAPGGFRGVCPALVKRLHAITSPPADL